MKRRLCVREPKMQSPHFYRGLSTCEDGACENSVCASGPSTCHLNKTACGGERTGGIVIGEIVYRHDGIVRRSYCLITFDCLVASLEDPVFPFLQREELAEKQLQRRQKIRLN